ncbi:MAG TPA: glycerophosphodiester phosphodiesterase [Bryobacteraceae bacterium]|nr:glycerophosphodiester phosphodiesterase [Bryobacteraceae bacterium]
MVRKLMLFVPLMAIAATTPRIVVHGHRGARAVLPENTMPAFEHAIEAGADLLELDLAVTKDDVLVVSHDPILNPVICRSLGGATVIRELTLAELRRWDCGSMRNPEFPNQRPAPGTRVPTLDEVLSLAPRGSFQFNIETKMSPGKPQYTPSPGRFAELLLAGIRKRHLEDRVMVQSFDYRTLRAMKRLAPGIRLSALFGDDARDFAAIARDAGTGMVSPHQRLVTPEKVAAAHAGGLTVHAWTANKPEEWDRLISAGVDGIITDDPAELVRHLRQRGLR